MQHAVGPCGQGNLGRRQASSLISLQLRRRLCALTVCTLAAFAAIALADKQQQQQQQQQQQVQPVLAPKRSSVRLQQAGNTSPRPACSPPTVDWSQFRAPGDADGGLAAVYSAEPVTDLRLLWLAHQLLRLDFDVTLLCPPQHLEAAQAFVAQARGGPLDDVAKAMAVAPAPEQDKQLLAAPARLFIHVAPASGLPTVRGAGAANLLLVTSASPGVNASSPPWDDVAGLLATYDYLLYTSNAGYAAHIPWLMPILQQLQLAGRMFPLLDNLPLPAIPLVSAAAAAAAARSMPGVTLSMSLYSPERRNQLVRGLKAFVALAARSPYPPRLIICTWLLPGVQADQDFVDAQIAALGLGPSVEFRSDNAAPDPYAGIAVQWHLFDVEDKPHSAALMAMPAGVHVVDCTGRLASAGIRDVTSVNAPAELAGATLAFLAQPHAHRVNTHLRIVRQSARLSLKGLAGKVKQVVARALRCKVLRFFMQHTQAAYQARLTPAIQQRRDKAAIAQHNGGRYAAAIVELRPHYTFLYVLLNAAWYLPGWALHVVHGRMNAGFVRSVLSPHLSVTYHQLETDNLNIDGYNRLMKDAGFWRGLDADHVLIFQTDSLILKPGLERFADFDYIGAPWPLNNKQWPKHVLDAIQPHGVGNGGFSLRSTKAMLRACEDNGPTSSARENEDIFFALYIDQDPGLKLADRSSAADFCFEKACADLPPPQPYALHAAWYYNNETLIQPLLDLSLKDLGATCP